VSLPVGQGVKRAGPGEYRALQLFARHGKSLWRIVEKRTLVSLYLYYRRKPTAQSTKNKPVCQGMGGVFLFF